MALSVHELAIQSALRSARLIEGVTVTYTRGATSFDVVSAVQAAIEWVPLDQDGAESVVEVVPWLINKPALTVGAPAVGDIITRTVDGVAKVYTVEFLGHGQNFWNWSDTGQTQYRILTRQDGSAAYVVTKPNGFDLSGTEIRYD